MKKIFFSLVALMCSMSMNAQVMKVVKGNDVVATYRGSDYGVVFEEKEEEKIDTWNYIGVGQWVETLPELFSEDALTLDVDVYESIENPGKYKFNGLGLQLSCWFYEEDMTNYENEYWYDADMIIDATDPENVIMPFQEMGFSAGSYGWPSIGNYYNEQLVGPATLNEGVISFSERGMVVSIGGSLYYNNNSGLCKLTLPTQSTAKPKFTNEKNLDSNKVMKMNSVEEYQAKVVR